MGRIGLICSLASVPLALLSLWLGASVSSGVGGLTALNTRKAEPITVHGVAWDSLIITAQTAVIVTVVVIMLVLLARKAGVFPKGGALWRKPLALPAIAFLLSVVMVIGSGSLPVSPYYEDNAILLEPDAPQEVMVVRSGNPYRSMLELRIECNLDDQQTADFTVRLWQNATEVGFTSVSLGPADGMTQYSEDSALEIDSGVYNVTLEATGNYERLRAELAQLRVSGYLEEVVDWDDYRLGLFAGGFLFFLVGLCYDTGTKSVRDERANSDYLLSDTMVVNGKPKSD